MKPINLVFASLRDQLAKDGWKILNDGGFQVTFQQNQEVVNLCNQGHGAIDWVCYIAEHQAPRDYGPSGYTGEQATPMAVFKIEGTGENCRIQQIIVDATVAKYGEVEVFVGRLNDGFRALIDSTHREIQRVLRPAAQS